MDPYNCLMGRMPPKGGTTLPGNGRLAEASASLAMLCLGVGVGLALGLTDQEFLGSGQAKAPPQCPRNMENIVVKLTFRPS
jgi:hypothetical protein